MPSDRAPSPRPPELCYTRVGDLILNDSCSPYNINYMYGIARRLISSDPSGAILSSGIGRLANRFVARSFLQCTRSYSQDDSAAVITAA